MIPLLRKTLLIVIIIFLWTTTLFLTYIVVGVVGDDDEGINNNNNNNFDQNNHNYEDGTIILEQHENDPSIGGIVHHHHHEPVHNDDDNMNEVSGLQIQQQQQQQQQQEKESPRSSLASSWDDDDENNNNNKYFGGNTKDDNLHHYIEFMNGCYEHYDYRTCQNYDTIRKHRNYIQPKLVHQNYTVTGYTKIMTPISTYRILREYWDKYSTSHLQLEYDMNSIDNMNHNNMHMNHWLAPTKILYLDPPPPSSSSSSTSTLPQMSLSNRYKMIHEIQHVLEQWIGIPLQYTSLYGIRTYTNHSIVAPHVDRIPLVISAIVNVAQQQVQEDWVFEMIGHDGDSINITIQPGEMILYESHSIIHGRPYPFIGQYYANCFFHYEPIGYTEQYYINLERLRHRRRQQQQQQGSSSSSSESTSSSSGSEDDSRIVPIQTIQEKYKAALAKAEQNRREEATTTTSTSKAISTESIMPPPPESDEKRKIPIQLPYNIIEGTIEAQRWRQEFEFHRVTLRHESYDDEIDEDIFPKIIPKKIKNGNTIGATSAHILAARNDIVRLKQIARRDPKSLDTPDINGWLPLHEAARGGCTEVVQFLVEHIQVSDINARTNNGEGGTALWWAEHGLPENHEVIQILKRNGAISIAPFQKKKKKKTTDTTMANNDDAKNENDATDKDQVEE